MIYVFVLFPGILYVSLMKKILKNDEVKTEFEYLIDFSLVTIFTVIIEFLLVTFVLRESTSIENLTTYYLQVPLLIIVIRTIVYTALLVGITVLLDMHLNRKRQVRKYKYSHLLSNYVSKDINNDHFVELTHGDFKSQGLVLANPSNSKNRNEFIVQPFPDIDLSKSKVLYVYVDVDTSLTIKVYEKKYNEKSNDK